MGWHSPLEVEANKRGGEVAAVHVGGAPVMVGEGA